MIFEEKILQLTKELQWNPDAIAEAADVCIKLRTLPDVIHPAKKGLVVWTTEKLLDTPFCNVIVRDKFQWVKCGTNMEQYLVEVSIPYDVTKSDTFSAVLKQIPLPVCVDLFLGIVSAKGRDVLEAVAKLTVFTNIACGITPAQTIIDKNSWEASYQYMLANPGKLSIFMDQIKVNIAATACKK